MEMDPVELEPMEKLAAAISTLPMESRVALEPFLVASKARINDGKTTVIETIEEVSQLQLEMRYLIFDLEATQQELDELLEQKRNSEL